MFWQAGFLERKVVKRHARYMLLHARNTGPLAPRIARDDSGVTDQNTAVQPDLFGADPLDLQQSLVRKHGDRLTEFSQLLGIENALAISHAFGGTIVYIPHDVPPVHALRALPQELIDALVKAYGGELLTIPKLTRLHALARNAAIIADRARGASLNDLARQYGLHFTAIHKIVSRS